MYDVLIVGGGPVGLMLACELRLGGLRTVILDKLREPSGHDRAGALHVRTLESLELRGLLDAFMAGTGTQGGLPMAGMFRRGLDFALLDTRHPHGALVPQSRTEALLAARAAELGAEIRRGHEVVGLAQDGDGVDVVAAMAGGERRFRARYVVGCDGGRGRTRRLAGIPFPGRDATVSALIGYVTTPERDVPQRWQRTPGGILVLAFPPDGGLGRVVVMEYDRRVDRDAPVTLDELRAAVARVRGEPLTLGEPVDWLSRFSDTTRQARRYRAGRVFVAGDAAHVHFPIGGQGLNLGLQDAMNLGWKLVAACGGAPDALLDTYHTERHPVAARVLLNTRAQLALMRPDDAHTTPLRELVDELLTFDNVNRYFGDMITGSGLRYPAPPDAHPWTGRFAGGVVLDGGPVAGLLHAGRPALLTLSGPDPEPLVRPWADRVDVVSGRPVSLPAWADGAPVPAAVLVRPDGYVAWAGGAGDGLTDALRGTWGAPAVEPAAR